MLEGTATRVVIPFDQPFRSTISVWERALGAVYLLWANDFVWPRTS